MSRDVPLRPLTADAFAPFGDVLEIAGTPDKMINAGLCGRFHDCAALDFDGGRAGISLFDATPRALPYSFDLLERHPDGSQAFVPMHRNEWLVIVAEVPDARPLAFRAAAGQGVNVHRGTWHGVCTPLHAPGHFAVIDRIGPGANLEERRLDAPWRVVEA